jgi:hypothetical protein
MSTCFTVCAGSPLAVLLDWPTTISLLVCVLLAYRLMEGESGMDPDFIVKSSAADACSCGEGGIALGTTPQQLSALLGEPPA